MKMCFGVELVILVLLMVALGPVITGSSKVFFWLKLFFLTQYKYKQQSARCYCQPNNYYYCESHGKEIVDFWQIPLLLVDKV